MTAATLGVRQVAFACDGAPIPARYTGFEHRTITSGSAGSDIDLHAESLAGAVLQRVGPRAADLVRIAAYAYRADQLVRRGETNNADGSRWKRRLALCVPVDDLAYWSEQEVTDALMAALKFATDDTWEFAFSPAGSRVVQIPLDIREQELLHRPGAVVLLSGGADSLCVVLEAAARGERPVAVGHWSTPAHKSRQVDLLTVARRRLRWQFPQIGFRIHGKGTESADNSQRSRAFLFAALGAAVAGEIGVEKVYLGDNGPVSLNLPINDQLVGARASRSTHPGFLDRFNRLVAGMFPGPVVVSNPLADRTRTQTLDVLVETGCEDLLRRTLSCSKWRGLPNKTPHCGGCSQCIDRRFATIAAGLQEYDPPGGYKQDVFAGDLEVWDDQMTAVSYLRFARRVNKMTDQTLLEEFPQLYDAIFPDDPDPDATLARMVEMTKRHARTVVDVFRGEAARALDAYAEGELPSTCLICLAGNPAIGQAEPQRAPSPPITEAVDVPRTETATAERVNAFWREADGWLVTFRGKSVPLKEQVGLLRIAGLLAWPGHEFTALELLRATEPAAAPDHEAHVDVDDDLRAQADRVYDTVIDKDLVVDFGKKTRLLLREAEAARAAGDGARVAAAEKEIAQMARYIEVNTKPDGTFRRLEDEVGALHENTQQAVRRALKKIKGAHPLLHTHLTMSLTRADVFVYAPDTPTPWDVRLS